MFRFVTLFLGFTIGTIASTATIVSTGFTPFDFASSTSLPLISRDELAIFADLSISALMPSPEPPPDREMFTPGLAFMYASSAAWATGSTVVEPLITMLSAKTVPAPTSSTANAPKRSFKFLAMFFHPPL